MHVYSSTKPANKTEGTITINEIPYKECSFVLAQNSRHTSSFYDVCNLYPFERLYEVTVFVNPIAFTSSETGFVDNIFVGMLRQDENSIIQAMENACSVLEPIVSKTSLAQVAEGLLEQYGDLNQKRSRIHIERIRRSS